MNIAVTIFNYVLLLLYIDKGLGIALLKSRRNRANPLKSLSSPNNESYQFILDGPNIDKEEKSEEGGDKIPYLTSQLKHGSSENGEEEPSFSKLDRDFDGSNSLVYLANDLKKKKSMMIIYVVTLSCSCEDGCKTPVNCKGDVVKDVCNCCYVCAKVEGELCGGVFSEYGKCSQGFTCVEDGRSYNSKGTCKVRGTLLYYK
ncbi:unnamed protein product [Gordionus sp. m RMFG-2023]